MHRKRHSWTVQESVTSWANKGLIWREGLSRWLDYSPCQKSAAGFCSSLVELTGLVMLQSQSCTGNVGRVSRAMRDVPSADCLRSTGITQKTMLDLGLPASRSSRLLGDAALPEDTHTAVFLDNVVISSSHMSISGRAVERGWPPLMIRVTMSPAIICRGI